MDTTVEIEHVTVDQATPVAMTILRQIGGINLIEFGVKNRWVLTEQRGGIELVLGGGHDTAGWRVQVLLAEGDVYDVEIYKIGRRGSKMEGQKVQGKSVSLICAEQLAASIGGFLFGMKWRAR